MTCMCEIYDLRDTIAEMISFHGIPARVEVVDTRIIVEIIPEE